MEKLKIMIKKNPAVFEWSKKRWHSVKRFAADMVKQHELVANMAQELMIKRIELHARNRMRGMVSVVIPIYDRTDVLRESIESILNQTYRNFELLLVCDGSPQATLDVVDAYAGHPKVRVFKYADNSGNAVRGRNRALLEARGEYFAFQDSDDIADPNRLKNSVRCMKLRRADVVYGTWRAMIQGREGLGLRDGQVVKSPDCDYEFLKKICVPCQSTVMAKTKALRDVGGLKTCMRYREDHELWLRLAYHGYRFKTCRKVLTNLRLHANNLELQYKDNDEHWKNLMLEQYTTKQEMPLRVGFVIPGCTISGGLSVIFTYANALKKHGVYVYMICTGEISSTEWFPNQAVEVFRITNAPRDLDVVVSTHWITDYFAQKIQAKRRVYLVQADERTFYDKGSLEYRLAEKTYLGSDREIVVIANWMEKWMKQEFGLASTVIPNGIRYQEQYADVRPLEEKGNKLRILIEGNPYVALKNVAAAFDIARRIENKEVWYINPVDGRKMESEVDRYFNSVPAADMPAIYASCDLLIKTSKYESYCLPALEMMAAGGSVIAFETDGVKEFIRNGENGFIVAQDDVQGAVDIINMLIEHPEERSRICSNARVDAAGYELKERIDSFVRLICQKKD